MQWNGKDRDEVGWEKEGQKQIKEREGRSKHYMVWEHRSQSLNVPE